MRDNIYEVDVINIEPPEDGDATQPIPVTQTNIVVPENNPTTIQLQSFPAAPSDDTDGDGATRHCRQPVHLFPMLTKLIAMETV